MAGKAIARRKALFSSGDVAGSNDSVATVCRLLLPELVTQRLVLVLASSLLLQVYREWKQGAKECPTVHNGIDFNPLPTIDAPMRYGLSISSIRL